MVNDIGFLYMCVRKPRNQICVRSRVNSAVALQSNWNDGHETNERRTTIVRKIEVVVVNLLDMNSGHKNIAEVSDFYCFTYTYIISNMVLQCVPYGSGWLWLLITKRLITFLHFWRRHCAWYFHTFWFLRKNFDSVIGDFSP